MYGLKTILIKQSQSHFIKMDIKINSMASVTVVNFFRGEAIAASLQKKTGRPIQCFVVELPPELRYSFSNVLVCGLSCGPEKT